MNGAAANLTTLGDATLSGSDMTAATLTNLATYLSERFTATANDDVVFAINWTAGGSTTTYIYDFTQSLTVNSTIEATELTLVGVVDRGATALVAGDLNA
jgi:recombinational DNA repair protein RecR